MTNNKEQESKKDRENEERSYKEAFDYFDWNKSGTIFQNISPHIIIMIIIITITVEIF